MATSQPASIISAMWYVVSLAAKYWSSTVLCFSSLISELPPIAMTASLRFAIILLLCHRQCHDGLLRVQAILCLIENHRIRTVHHRAGHFNIAIRGERMHVDGVIFGKFHLFFIGDPMFVLVNDLRAFVGIFGRHHGSPRLGI